MEISGEAWFVGKDVASVLGYKNGSRDINAHVDEEDKLKYQISTAGQKREQTFINESGLYSLILSSKLPTAKKFKKLQKESTVLCPKVLANSNFYTFSAKM